MNPTEMTAGSAWATLSTIMDPEFGINIVDLGLVYEVKCSEGEVEVLMTLTAPTCPAGAWLLEGASEALRRTPGVRKVTVSLTFDPPWTPQRLSGAAREELGMLS